MAYSLPDVLEALRSADAAGNVEDARKLADIAHKMRQSSRMSAPTPMPMPATPELPKAEPETGFMAGLRAGFEGLKGDIAAIGATAGVEGAEEYAKGQREKVSQIYRQPEFKEAPVSYLTGLLGQSVPYMLAPVAAGVLAPEALGAAGAAAAATAVSAGQFTGSNISRQMEEGKSAKDVEVAKAVAASIPQAALDTLSLRMVPGLGKVLGKAGVQMTEAELEQVAKHGIVSGMADKVRQYGPAVLKTSGTEGLTEAAQQVLERAQAGLNLTDENAKKEYYDNFIGGALLGGTLAVPGRAIERSVARTEAEQKRDERLRGEEDKRVQAEAKTEAERKAAPDYLLGLEPQLTELQDKVKELRKERGKKPGKNADPEAHIEWKEKTDEIRAMMGEMRDLQSEIKTNKPKIEVAREEQRRQGMTEQEYFDYTQYGIEPKAKEEEEAAPKDETLESWMESTKFKPKEEITSAEDAAKIAQDKLQPLRFYAENTGAPLSEHVKDAVEILMRDPSLARSIVDNNIRIPDFGAKESKAIVGALKLQLKEQTAELVKSETKSLERIGENVRSAEDLKKQLDTERYALRNIAQDKNNPVGLNETLNEIVRLLEAKTEKTVESEVKRAAKPGAVAGRRTAGEGVRTERAPALVFNDETNEYEEQKTPGDAAALRVGLDNELLRMIERFRVLQQQKGAARDSAELTDLAEKIRIAAQPQRNEVIGGPTVSFVSLLEKPGEKSSYRTELDRLSKEQNEAFPAALDAVRAASEYRKNPVAPPLTGTLSAKSGSPEQRIEAESVRLDAEERKARGRFTTAVLQEVEANRRANAVPSVTKDEANLIAGRINNMLQMAAARKFGAPTEAMDVIRDDIAKIVTQYSDVERVKGTPKRVELVGPRKPATTEEVAAEEVAAEEVKQEAAPVVPYNEEPGSFLANFRQFTQTQKEEREEIKKEVKQVTAVSKQEGMTAKRALDVVNAHVDAMAAKLETLVNAVRQQRRIAERSGTKSPGFAKIEADITQRLETFAEDQKKVQQYYETLKRYRGIQDQSADALVKVYNRLDKQRRDVEKRRDVLKPTTPQARTALRAYNQQIAEIDKEFEEMRSGFASSGKEIDTAVTAFEKKIQSIQNFQDALADDATVARQPVLQYLKTYINKNKAVKAALEEATGLRKVFDTLQQQRREFISKIAGAKRAAAAIEAGKGKTAAERMAESQAEASRQTGLGLPGTKVTRADIKSDIALAEDTLAEERDRLEKMRDDREDMNSREGIDKQEKSALTRLIKTAEEKTIPNIESEIDSLKQEAKGMTESAVKETSKPAGVLPATKQATEAEEFKTAFNDFLLSKDLAREFDEEGFPIKKARGPYTKTLSPPQIRTPAAQAAGPVRVATEAQKTKAAERIAKQKPKGDIDTSKTGWDRFNKGDVMFRVGDESITPVSFESVKSYIKQVKEGLPENVDFTFVENLDSLPKEFRDYMVAQGVDLTKNRIRGGVLPNGKVFVISNAHRSQSELELTIAHELIGHYGIDSMLGSKGIGALVRAIERGEGGIYGLAARLGPSVMDGVLVTSTAYNERIRAAKEANKPASEIAALEKARRVAMVRELVAYASETTNAQTATENKRFRDAKSLQELWKLIVAAFRNAAIKAGFKYIVKADTQDIYRFLRESTRSMADKTVGAYKTIDNEIVFARTATYGTIPVGVADTARKLVATQQRTMDRIKSEATGIGARTLYVDRFAPLERVAEYLKKSSQAMQMMYYARMHDQRSAWVGATVNSGAPKIQLDSKGNRIIVSGGGANLKDIAEELNKVKIAGMNAEGVRNLFTLYLAANRAKNKGIHVLNFSGSITQTELKEALRVGSSIPQFTKAQKLYNEYNNGLVDWLEQSGAISAKLAAELKKDQDYVPFYRAIGDSVVMEVGGMKPIAIGNIQQQPYLRELVGGDTKIQDFFNSALQNTSLLVDMGLRNLATKEAAFGLANAGLLGNGRIKIGTGPAQPNVLRFNKDGVEYHAIVDRASSEAIGIPAELLVRGMHGVVVTSGTITKVMSIPAKWLRDMITRSPVYAARQVVRDSMTNFLLAGGNMTPVASAAKELTKMYAGVSEGEKKLQERGIIGGQLLTGTSEDMQKLLLQLTKGGLGWDLALAKLDRMHMKADAASRITLYNDYCKQGLSDMEATLATLESMNFSKRGVDSSLYSLNMMVPFLNSQIQGLNVLYQAFAGKLPYADKLAIQRKLYTRGMLMAGATVAYAMMMQDDDAYKNASMQDRLQNWFIKVPGLDQPVKVPIPFEIGLIFKAMPEAIMLAASKDQDASKVMIGMGKLIAMSSPVGVATAVPAGVKPLLEATMNRSLYTGLDIESKAEQMLLPQERVREKTTEIAKVLSGAIGAITEAAGMPSKGVSPVMIDHLINGYSGGMGLAIAQGVSLLIPTEGPKPATKRLSDMPVIGSMFQPTDAGGQITTFYEKAEEYGEIKKTVDKLIEEGKKDEAIRMATKYAKQITLSEVAESFKTDMNEFTQLEKMTRSSNMPPETKRVKLDQIREAKIIFARSFNAASRQ